MPPGTHGVAMKATAPLAASAAGSRPRQEDPDLQRPPQKQVKLQDTDGNSSDGRSDGYSYGCGYSYGDGDGDGDGDADGDGDGYVDGDDGQNASRNGKRKRPVSVSCELCKLRKVKCDRGQPACGWCSRNNATCEYKERKKPGLRAGYGRELEARLDKLETILRKHSELLQMPFDSSAQPPTGAVVNPSRSPNDRTPSHPHPQAPQHSVLSTPSPLFPHATDTAKTPQAEAALFLQKPCSAGSFTPLNNTTYASSSASAAVPRTVQPLPSNFSPSHHMQSSALATQAARDYYGASAPPPLSANGSTSAGVGPGAATATATSSPAANASTSSDRDLLPPHDLSYALVDLYFKHINTWCPLLQRTPTIDALFGSAMADETNQILLHAIVATTLRFSTDARLTDEKRQRYHEISKQRVLLYGMENMSVKALQALVILALDFCGSSNGPPGWNIMALITRAVVQLGLAVEHNSFSISPSYKSIYTLRARILAEPRDFIEEESRRRLFWVIYLLDRYATIATAFEFALDDRDIDRMLPCRDDLWAKNQKVETRLFQTDYSDHDARGNCGSLGGRAGAGGTRNGDSGVGADGFEPATAVSTSGSGSGKGSENLGAFSHYIEILGILTRIHNFLKQPVDISSLSDVEQWQMRYRELDQMLNNWKVGLPDEYGNMSKVFQPNCAKTINCGWIMLHVTYNTAIIRLHSSAAYPTTRSPIFTPSYSASQRCHTAVENIGTLCNFVVSHSLLPKLGPPFAFSLWVAARLYLVHGSTVEHKLSQHVSFFVDTLQSMSRYWPVAGRYCALLQRVLDEHSDSERQGDGVTPSSVRILADMRRTAFDLDLLISRQPRHGYGDGNGARGHSTGADGAMTAAAAVFNGSTQPSGNENKNGAASRAVSRFPSHHPTPARTPQPDDLEYLDVFDFFNMPRLPFNLPTEVGNGAVDGHRRFGSGAGGGDNANGNSDGNGNGGLASDATSGVVTFSNEPNLNDFMVDANRDWLYKHTESSKYLAL